MIITNGTISAKEKQSGVISENGYPVEQPELWSQPVPCRITTIKGNKLADTSGNKYVDASYNILIELQSFEAEQVRLMRFGKDLGTFSVRWIEPLNAVNAIKITV